MTVKNHELSYDNRSLVTPSSWFGYCFCSLRVFRYYSVILSTLTYFFFFYCLLPSSSSATFSLYFGF